MLENGFSMSTKGDIIYTPKRRYSLNEAQKIQDIVPGFPVNKRMKYDQALMVKAIQNGMIILISYTGEKDSWKGGRERVIQPMVLGQNRNTKNFLIRSWHLEGYSVSQKRETKKVWRLFNAANIHWMMFVGNFYRLPPVSYRMNDRVMTEQTIARADFNQIRRNQDALIRAGKIEDQEKVNISPQGAVGVPSIIEIKSTSTILDLRKPWENELLTKIKKDAPNIKISILKAVFSGDYLAIMGALGKEGSTVKVYAEKKLLGSYKTLKSFTADQFDKNKIVGGKSEFDLYTFVKKL